MSPHWYDPATGLLRPETVATQAGGLRPYDLRDARKDGALASVTTMLQTLARPGLEVWKQEKLLETAALAMWALPWDRDKVSAIRTEAFREVDEASAFGSAVHAGFDARVKGNLWAVSDMRVALVVDGLWDWIQSDGRLKVLASEMSFTNLDWGYAGTLDIVGTWEGQPCIADIKTQDFSKASEAQFYDPEHPLQLAGYSLGTGSVDHLRVGLVCSRSVPGLGVPKAWPDNNRYDRMWVNLVCFWQDQHKYWPGKVYQPESDKVVEFRR